MRPSPKLPTSRSPPKRPNERGACASPQGAFKHPTVPEPREQFPVAVELVDVAAGRRVVAVHRRAIDVRDEDMAADRLDAERRVPGGNRPVDEGSRQDDAVPLPVVDVDASVVEVGRVDAGALDRDTTEDGGGGTLVDDDLGLGRPAAAARWASTRAASRPRTRR